MKFTVRIELEVDEDGNILSTTPQQHEEDVKELFQDLLYDVDDVKAETINVRKK
jgi:hypothetical protein